MTEFIMSGVVGLLAMAVGLVLVVICITVRPVRRLSCGVLAAATGWLTGHQFLMALAGLSLTSLFWSLVSGIFFVVFLIVAICDGPEEKKPNIALDNASGSMRG